MNGQVQLWMPAILSVFGTLIVVLFTAWLNTRTVLAHIEAVRSEITGLGADLHGEIRALRAEFKKDLAELELRLTMQISALDRRIERLEEQRGLVRP
jgi:hypothetical protein